MTENPTLDEAREALRIQLNMLGTPVVAVMRIEALIDAKLRSLPAAPDGGKEGPVPSLFPCAGCSGTVRADERYALAGPEFDGKWFHKQCARVAWEKRNAETKATNEADATTDAADTGRGVERTAKNAVRQGCLGCDGRSVIAGCPVHMPPKVTPPPAPEPVCPTCGGKGEVEAGTLGAIGPMLFRVCPDCNGTGKRPSPASPDPGPPPGPFDVTLPVSAFTPGTFDKRPSSEPSEGKGERLSDDGCLDELDIAIDYIEEHGWPSRDRAAMYLARYGKRCREFERSRAAQQRAPEGEAVSLTVEELEALELAVGDHTFSISAAQSALRKLNARAGVESAKAEDECIVDDLVARKTAGRKETRLVPEAKPDASEGDEDGARRAYEHAGKRVADADVPWPRWDANIGDSWRRFLVEFYRFVRAEGEAKLVAMESNAATVADQYERLEAKFRAVCAESEGRIRELEDELDGWRETDDLPMRTKLDMAAQCHLSALKLAQRNDHRAELAEKQLGETKEKLHASESRVKALEGQVAEMLAGGGVPP